jgi:hypothetical protein
MPIAPIREFLAVAFNQRFRVEALIRWGKHHESPVGDERIKKPGTSLRVVTNREKAGPVELGILQDLQSCLES